MQKNPQIRVHATASLEDQVHSTESAGMVISNYREPMDNRNSTVEVPNGNHSQSNSTYGGEIKSHHTGQTGSAHFGDDVGIQANFPAADAEEGEEYNIDAQNLGMLERLHLSSEH